jgi:Protein of unknown function (DUF3500)
MRSDPRPWRWWRRRLVREVLRRSNKSWKATRSTKALTRGHHPAIEDPAVQVMEVRPLHSVMEALHLGTPSEKNPWMLQFGGHHLALNITMAGERGVLTPTLTGAQPALYTMGGKTVRPLGAESDKALALLNGLDENQRKKALLSYQLADLVLGPGQDGKTIQPEHAPSTFWGST